MGRKCSVGGCKTGYDSQTGADKVTMYGFPSNETECRVWISNLPNILPYEKVAKSKNYSVCALHFPADVSLVRRGSKLVPSVPPSIFPNVLASSIPTPQGKCRPTTKSITMTSTGNGDLENDIAGTPSHGNDFCGETLNNISNCDNDNSHGHCVLNNEISMTGLQKREQNQILDEGLLLSEHSIPNETVTARKQSCTSLSISGNISKMNCKEIKERLQSTEHNLFIGNSKKGLFHDYLDLATEVKSEKEGYCTNVETTAAYLHSDIIKFSTNNGIEEKNQSCQKISSIPALGLDPDNTSIPKVTDLSVCQESCEVNFSKDESALTPEIEQLTAITGQHRVLLQLIQKDAEESNSIDGNSGIDMENVMNLSCHMCHLTFQASLLLEHHKILCPVVRSKTITSTPENDDCFTLHNHKRRCTQIDSSISKSSDHVNMFSGEEEKGLAKNNSKDEICLINFNQKIQSSEIPLKPIAYSDSLTHSKLPKNPIKIQNETHYVHELCTNNSDQNFSSQGRLMETTGEKPFTCTDCGKSFYDNSTLHRHMRTHSGEKPFKCDECGKSFSVRFSLRAHIRTHTGEKPFKCDECGQNFCQNQQLNRHMRIHTGEVREEKKFKCALCNMSFYTRSKLNRHMKSQSHTYKCNEIGKSKSKSFHLSQYPNLHKRIHSGENPFKCAKCSMSFYDSSSLHKHMKSQSHTEKNPFRCDDCGKSFAHRGTLKVHIKAHTKIGFPCHECGKSFSYSIQLHKHMRTHTGEKPFKCVDCGKSFSLSNTLHTHMETHREEPFKCDECGNSFRDGNTLHTHMRTHTGDRLFRCDACGIRFSQNGDLQVHMKTHKHKSFQCDECGQSFNQNDDLQIHIATHRDRPFKCDQCDMSFCVSSTLHRHMRTHLLEKPFKCDDCGKSFWESNAHQTHMRTHTGEKRFRCDECGKSFTHLSVFRGHMRSHTGEKPFKCDECGKSFSRSCSLRIHMRRHTGEKRFRCDECGKTYYFNSEFSMHMRTHRGEKPFMCDECGKNFCEFKGLKRHMRTHAGEKPFPCAECGKSFAENAKLRIHMRIHTGEKPYQCDLCGKSFSQSGTLHIHMRTHTR